jgi:transcriptional regulator with XRE-family HTH domain
MGTRVRRCAAPISRQREEGATVTKGEVNLSEVSRKTGYTLSHISRVFSSRREPSMRCLMAVAKALGLSVDETISLIEKGDSEKERQEVRR